MVFITQTTFDSLQNRAYNGIIFGNGGINYFITKQIPGTNRDYNTVLATIANNAVSWYGVVAESQFNARGMNYVYYALG